MLFANSFVWQDLSDVGLVHSWCLFVVAALEGKDFVALRNLLAPVNTRHQVCYRLEWLIDTACLVHVMWVALCVTQRTPRLKTDCILMFRHFIVCVALYVQIISTESSGAASGTPWRLLPSAVVSSVLAAVRTKAVHSLGQRFRPHHGDYVRVSTVPEMEPPQEVQTLQSLAPLAKAEDTPKPVAAPGPPKPSMAQAPSQPSGPRERALSGDGSNAFTSFRRRLSSDGMGDNVISDAIFTDDGPVEPAEAVRRAAAPLKAAVSAVQATVSWFDGYVDACMRFLVSANVLALLQSIVQSTPRRT